ncbi:MAG: rhodanese-like domain-containing protein [Bacteroidetes bacterium]|nr:rhodanese-like domain-containing protein [Bacteroidota bacterium]
MIATLKKIFGIPSVNYKSLIHHKGAIVIDVRTKEEYQQGHVVGSVNIPLSSLSKHFETIRKDKPLITCCASGLRSAQAKSMLKANGYLEVYNGGSWTKVRNKIA